MKVKKISILFLMATTMAHAQKDVASSKDSELLSRYPESWIVQYSQKEYERYTVALDNTYPDGKSKVIEGKHTSIDYELPKGKSQLEFYKNYEDAFTRKGYDILFSCYQEECNPKQGSFTSIPYALYQKKLLPGLANGGNTYRKNASTYLIAEKTINDKTVTITVMSGFESYSNVYRFDIVTSRPLDLSKVTINDIESKLEEEGRIALYGIRFDLNSARLKPESQESIELLADYLKANPTINLFVVGHTDASGDFEKNMTLSKERAMATVKELIDTYGIASSRLTADGVAMLAPVASNENEKGRALNRRVEIVKRTN
ncbi:DUF4892 domain-containing protein [Fulvivirga sp. M361]|uniref:OmpA family protein n=1 Tax=Fulvivirga sp. M361 TaxID=2594266 RepID=UPI00117AF7D1|nr:OmpA family protein [Fulvivirga sp. M361]TRX59059.1 DUF4892 domain-containing protein [Fulvivirga sp. M361]